MYVIFNQTLQLQPINTGDFFFISLASVRKIGFLECQIAKMPMLAIFLDTYVIMYTCLSSGERATSWLLSSESIRNSSISLYRVCCSSQLCFSCLNSSSAYNTKQQIHSDMFILHRNHQYCKIHTHMCDGQTSFFTSAR